MYVEIFLYLALTSQLS